MKSDVEIGDEDWPYRVRLTSLPSVMDRDAEDFYVWTMSNIGALGVDWTFMYDKEHLGFVYCFKTIESFTLFKLAWIILVTDQNA